MSGPRDFGRLSAGAQRRWIAAVGGPRSLGHERRLERARQAYEAGEHLPAEHTGHQAAPIVTHAATPTTRGVRRVRATTRVEATRLGQYDRDVQRLLEGDLDPMDFGRRWRRRVRRVGGVELEADPNRVLALMAAAGALPQPFYVRRSR